jgi:hypothetical protein
MPADTALQIPDTRTLKQKLEQKILNYYQTIWQDAYIKGDTYKKWLENFDDDNDDIQEQQHLQMLYLLSKFMYFGHLQIRELLRALFRDLVKYPIIEQIRRSNKNSLDMDYINHQFREELNKTRLLGVGNPSESGIHLLYYLRQEWNLEKDLFIDRSEMLTMKEKSKQSENENQETHQAERQRYWISERKYPEVKRYIFIDDFCGSGSQVIKYLTNHLKNFKTEYPDIEISYLVLFGTEQGIQKVKEAKIFDRVEAVTTLDKTFKAFDWESRYFKNVPDDIDRNKAHNIAIQYGKQIHKEAPIGHEEGQLLIGFFHNTPDNTLPIFWAENEDWQPVFKRYGKNY